MATTSGTIGQTRVDAATIVDHAFRRCGKLASTVSGELLQSARENLFFLLSDLANRGLSLWCIEKYVLGLRVGDSQLDLPVGVVDVLNTLYRTTTVLTGTPLSGAGYQGIDLGAADNVTTVGLQFTAASAATIAYEWSNDGATWVTEATLTLAAAAGAWVYQDVDGAPQAQYWRVRDVTGALAALTTLEFSNAPYEVPMSPLNRDEYVMLPNKTFGGSAGSKSLQYWFDKQIVPRIWLWPTAPNTADQIVVWSQRHIQDVGALSNKLDVPQRWLESVILTLACRVAVELPKGELPEGRLQYLEAKAAEHLERAEDGESDGSPIRLVPNIAGYTR